METKIIFPKSFIDFTRLCEICCVAGCCGLDAFSFDNKTIYNATQKLGKNLSLIVIQEAESFRREMEKTVICCFSEMDEFNATWENGKDLSNWMEEICETIREEIK